jgi:Arc/MetJ family transcription regulator
MHMMCASVYSQHMRTVVEIDDEALAGAAAELGTTTKKDTINTALRLIASRRDRAVRVASATHVFGDPRGWDDPDVQRELADGRGRRRRDR